MTESLDDVRRRQAEMQSDHEPPAAVEPKPAATMTLLDPKTGERFLVRFTDKGAAFSRDLANAFRL